MPNLSDFQKGAAIKTLVIGDSGTGKTGALASLAIAGYKLRILDYDAGLAPLVQYVKGHKDVLTGLPAIDNIKYETLQDPLKSVGGVILPSGQPTAFQKGLALLDKWAPPDASENLGSPSTWGLDTILVVDTLTFMSAACMRRAQALVGRSGKTPEIQDWGAAMSQIEDLLTILYSQTIKCHVIVNSHITYIEIGEGMNKGYPNTLGNKLPPKVGRWFNYILQVKSVGSGASAKRYIYTQPEGMIDVKCPIPGLATKLSLESGLAEFFAAASKV